MGSVTADAEVRFSNKTVVEFDFGVVDHNCTDTVVILPDHVRTSD